MKQPSTEWSRTWTAAIGRAVRAARDKRGLSAEQLGTLCGELGFPLTRASITNLENGRRELIPVHEIAVIARALDVPPIQLLYPVGHADQVEVLPGIERHPQEGLTWFTGEWPLLPHPGLSVTYGSYLRWARRDTNGVERFVQDSRPVHFYREHARCVDAVASHSEAFSTAQAMLDSFDNPDLAGDEPTDLEDPAYWRFKREHALRALDIAREQLREIRALMRDIGIEPPPLHGSYRAIDEAAPMQSTLFGPDDQGPPESPRQDGE